MMAEYERAKSLERHRRGKLHAARAGKVNVLGGAPYGYRYIDKHAGGGQARYEILPEEARVVCQVFDWVGRDRVTIGEVCRRLTQAGERTRTGRTVWERSVVGGSAQSRLSGHRGLWQNAPGASPPAPAGAAWSPAATTSRDRRLCSAGQRVAPYPCPGACRPSAVCCIQEQVQENRRHAR